MTFLSYIVMASTFIVVGCSHIQKVHYYDSKTTDQGDVVEQPVFKPYRYNGCALLPVPLSINSTQSKIKLYDAG